jgi:tetratricopeptide (TPR) repeat protein
MKLFTTTAVALAAATAAVPAFAQYGSAPAQPMSPPPANPQKSTEQAAPTQPKITPSKGAMKAIIDLQSAVQKNDYASVAAKVATAQAVATTKEDRYLIGRLKLEAAAAAKDTPGIASAIDSVAASNYLGAADLSKLYVGLGGTYYNSKQYAQAAAAYQKALAINPQNSEAAMMVGDAFAGAGQKTEALAAYQRLIQSGIAAGQKPDEGLFKRAVAAAYDANSPASVTLARQWVAAYPSPASWSDAIAIYSNLNHPDAESAVDLYRLRQLVGALRSGGEYAQYARSAAELNNFNEAKAALDAGIAAKAIDPSKAEYRDLVDGLKAKPKATAADLAEATKTAQSGMALLRIGDRYYAMGDYAKAVELYRMAMGKPGVDSAVANLHVGMGLARAGDKAGATAALNAVTGPRADIAKFWLTWVNQKA